MSENNDKVILSFEEIKELACLVADKKLGKIALKSGDMELVIEAPKEKMCPPLPMIPQMQGMLPQGIPALGISQGNTTTVINEHPCDQIEKIDEKPKGNTVKSPIIGTYYNAPAPNKPPFVQIGQKIKKGDVIMIIESMKLMNEIQSQYDGTVLEILVEDGTAVEFDQPIMIIG